MAEMNQSPPETEISMTDNQCKRFIKALYDLSPNKQFNPGRSLSVLKTQGLDGFMRSADGNTAELVEIAELLICMEKRGVHDESG